MQIAEGGGPEDLDEPYVPTEAGSIDQKFDVPWYVMIGLGNYYALGMYGLKKDWYPPYPVPGYTVYQAIQGQPAFDYRAAVFAPKTLTKSIEFPPNSFQRGMLSEGHTVEPISVDLVNNSSTWVNVVPRNVLWNVYSPEMYQVPSTDGVEQTMDVSVRTLVAPPSSDEASYNDGVCTIGLSAHTRGYVYSNGATGRASIEGLFFELAVTTTKDDLSIDRWQLVAVTDHHDGPVVLGTSTKNLPEHPQESRTITLSCKDGVASCYVNGDLVIRKDVPDALKRETYAAPAAPASGGEEGWVHAGPGNMFVGRHTSMPKPKSDTWATDNVYWYRGRAAFRNHTYAAYRAGCLGTLWTGWPAHTPGAPEVMEKWPVAKTPFGQGMVALTPVTPPELQVTAKTAATVMYQQRGNVPDNFVWGLTSNDETAVLGYGKPAFAAVNTGTADGVLFSSFQAPPFMGIADDGDPGSFLPGLVVRGNPKTKEFLYVEVSPHGGPNKNYDYAQMGQPIVRLWKYGAGGDRVLLSEQAAPLVIDTTTADGSYKAYKTYGMAGTGDYTAVPVAIKTVGSSVKVYLAVMDYYKPVNKPVLALNYTLTGDDADTFGKAATLVGAGATAVASITHFAFVTKTPQDLFIDPPQVVDEPEAKTQTDGDGEVVGHTGIGDTTGVGFEGDDGSEYTVEVDNTDPAHPVAVIKKKDPAGHTTEVARTPVYPTATPNSPLKYIIRKNGTTLTIYFNGQVWFTYELTGPDLAGMSLSTKYINFYTNGVLTKPPAGTVLIKERWSPRQTGYALAIPALPFPAGSGRLWGRVALSRGRSLLVRQDNTVYVSDAPTSEEVSAAKHFWQGGHVHPILEAEVAQVIADAGYETYLREIEV